MICCGLQSVKRVHVSILFFDLIYWIREANAHVLYFELYVCRYSGYIVLL